MKFQRSKYVNLSLLFLLYVLSYFKIKSWCTQCKTGSKHWRMLVLVDDLICRRGWFCLSIKAAQINFWSQEQDYFVWNLFIRWIRAQNWILNHSRWVNRLLSRTVLARDSPWCGGTCVKLWVRRHTCDVRKKSPLVFVLDYSFTATPVL